jgi:hypothetical protein
MGATTTLQRFYAATGYAVVPLVFTALSPIPCLGAIVSLVAWIWALVIYVQALRVVTRLEAGPAVLCLVAPAAVTILGVIIAVSIVATTFARFFL